VRFPHLAQRLFNVPIAITPDKAEVVMAALADRFGVARLFRGNGELAALEVMAFDDEGYSSRRDAPRRGYDTVEGVALIPIEGTLVQKLGTLRPYSGMTGYDGIRQNLFEALADPDVKAIVFDIDSPGGEVAGCFDLVDTIYNVRGEKPIWAVLDECAYSAAYAIASAADRITVPRTGGSGSVGVICMHVDLTQALAKEGISVRVIRYGAQKAEGGPYESLADEALGRIQADINAMGELFVETVARNRNLAADVVRGQEAATFRGELGVAQGLADAVMAPDAAFQALLAELG